MHAGKLVFAQVMEFAPWRTFRRLVGEYRGDFNVRSFSCLDQFLCLAFAQLTYRESLRDIEACLCTQPAELYSLGPLGNVSRSALADTNEDRDWRIYYEVAQSLIRTARRLYAEGPIGVDISETVYALDPTTIDLCLALLPWARFRATKAAIKLHTLLDLLTPKPGAFFVTRAKSNSRFNRLLSRPVDRSTGLICDLCVELVVFYSHQGYSERLRRIVCRDPERDKRQAFPGHQRERGENADLVCRGHLCADRHRQEEGSSRCFALHMPTDLVGLGLRENRGFMRIAA